MKARLRLVVGLGLALALAACGSTTGSTQQAPKASKPAAAQAKPATPAPAPAARKRLVKVSVMMSYLATGWDAGFWVAQDKGFYKQEGLDVTPQPGKATFQTVENVATGKITFGQLDGGTLITAVDRGLPLVGVAQLLKRQPFAILVPASSAIKTIAQLKGKRVGDNPANATAQLLPGVLSYNHMSESEIRLVNMSNHTLPVALMQHRVDAIAGLSIGQGAVIEFKGMPLRFLLYSANGLSQPGFGIATSTAYARKHPGIVRRFILGTRMGMAWTRQHPVQAEAMLHKDQPHTNVKLLTKQLKLSLPLWSKPAGGPYNVQQYKAAQQALLKFGVVKKTTPIAKIITNQYVPK